MSWYNFSSLRKRLFIFIFLAFMPALLLMILSGADQRRTARQNVQENAFNMIQPISAEFEQIIDGSKQLLIVLARMPAVRNKDSVATSALFKDLLSEDSAYASIGAVDINGNVFASGIPLKNRVNLSDRLYFKEAIRTNGFALGSYQIGRITHKATINAGYPIHNSAGRINGVVFTAIDLQTIGQSLEHAKLPQGSVINLIDADGTILVREPKSANLTGRSLSDIDLGKSILRHKTGTIEAMGIDGVHRLYAFTPLVQQEKRPGAYLIVGIPSDIIYHDANATLFRNLLLMGLVFVLTLVLSWVGIDFFVIRKIDGLVRATSRIAAGELHARTDGAHGDDELDRLALRFNEMAESVEQLTRRNQSILSSAGEGIYGLDRVGNITFVNPAAALLLGYEIGELVGKHAALIECPEDARTVQSSPAICLETAQRIKDVTLWKKDCTSFPVNYVKAPIQEHGVLVGAVVVFDDISEQKKLEDHKRDFYRRTILAATEGKLIISEADEIKRIAGDPLKTWTIKPASDLSEIRNYVAEEAQSAGMDETRVGDFVLCVGESTTNVLKHAGEGIASLHKPNESFIFVVTDKGPGILAINLPDVALKRGYTTAISLGMGYKAMISLADRVYLATGPEGTTVAMEMKISASDVGELIANLPDTWAGA